MVKLNTSDVVCATIADCEFFKMSGYVAFLGSINVGGNQLKMAELRFGADYAETLRRAKAITERRRKS